MEGIKNYTQLTPIQKIGNYFFKRDDLFKPFDDISVNGNKLRQCIYLVNKIKNKYNHIITGCNLISPQSLIVSSVCKNFNIRSTIVFGGTSISLLEKRKNLQYVIKNSNIEIINSGFNSVLNYYIKNKIDNNLFTASDRYFHIQYGINLKDNIDCLIESTANQIENIPDYLDNLVLCCGSGISSVGILYGIYKYNKKIKNIYLIGNAPNRKKFIDYQLHSINNLYKTNYNAIYTYIDLFNTDNFRYNKRLYIDYYDIKFHPNYEAKAFNWLLHNINKSEITLFYIIGSEVIFN